MSDVLKCTYADLKTVKTRSSCQIILEMPIEALTDVVRLLGAPVPGEEVWVAVARLKPEAAVTATPHRPLSQAAAILCDLQPFRRFLSERLSRSIVGKDEAAVAVRELCGVASRRELDTNTVAAGTFRDLRTDYRNWMHGAEQDAA